MGFSFAHGTQKRWIVAALWQLLLFKFGDNPRQVSFIKHARPFQWSTPLRSFFKNLSCQRLSPNSRRDREHPTNYNHNAIWLVWIFVHLPVFAKSCRLDPEKLQIAKAEFKRLESAGIVRRSKSPRASPLHMVPKKDGSWRPCGDYCHLNLVTTPDKYPLPNMQDLSNGLHNCTIFCKNWSCQGLSLNPCCDRGHPKNAIWFVWIFVHPFWAVQSRTNIPENDGPNHRWFERCICLYGCVGSPDRQTHLQHLEAFFKALAANGLAINSEKCVFATPSLEILGHTISVTGAAPRADHAAEIKNCPPPQDIKQL